MPCAHAPPHSSVAPCTLGERKTLRDAAQQTGQGRPAPTNRASGDSHPMTHACHVVCHAPSPEVERPLAPPLCPCPTYRCGPRSSFSPSNCLSALVAPLGGVHKEGSPPPGAQHTRSSTLAACAASRWQGHSPPRAMGAFHPLCLGRAPPRLPPRSNPWRCPTLGVAHPRRYNLGSAPVSSLKILRYLSSVWAITSGGSSSGVALSKLIDLR